MNRFSSLGRFNSTRSEHPLSDEQIARVAPSIFAASAHESRSARYAHIPSIDVLNGLRNQGFQPFMVSQTKVRNVAKQEYTKHMIRLRHADQINHREANEIILLNSHDGTSSYRMLGGMFRFVCANGMVCGDTVGDVRVPHKGDVVDRVIEGAFKVLQGFEESEGQREDMQHVTLTMQEQRAFANAALSLKYEEEKAPITEDQILLSRRSEDSKNDLWSTFSRVQENLIKGGLSGRNRNGRSTTTRAVTGIDQDVKLNRALWILAEQMKAIKA